MGQARSPPGWTYNRAIFAPVNDNAEQRLDRLEHAFPEYLQAFNTEPPFNDSQLELNTILRMPDLPNDTAPGPSRQECLDTNAW